MSNNYRYDHRTSKSKKRQSFVIIFISLVIVGILGLLLTNNINKSTLDSNSTVSGPSKVVGVVTSPSSDQTTTVNEPDYTFQLPNSWKLYTQAGTGKDSIITWRSGKSDDNTRTITIYEDDIPSAYALNYLMPVTANGATLEVGSMSTNCTDFTTDSATSNYTPTSSKWDGVNFICNVPDRFDDQVGTGSVGSSLNSVTLSGASTGTHSYFFLYIDRSAQPDYTYFVGILDSFKAL